MNRTEEKLLKKQAKRRKLKKLWTLFICFVFFIIMIYVTDVKTSELVLKKDGKHAFYIDIESNNYIRIDVAGETYKLNIEIINSFINKTLNWSKKAFQYMIGILSSCIVQ